MMAGLAELDGMAEDIIPIPLEIMPNTMNDNVDTDRLLKYLDPEFIHAKPDEKTITTYQYEHESKEKMGMTTKKRYPQCTRSKTSIPREYQYELFQKALKENIIAVLGTGSGKTLISVMLIKMMNIQEREERLTRRKASIMTVFFGYTHVS